jgi:tellurium resistance protein TerD
MELANGGNAVVGAAGEGGLAALVLGVTWDSGPLECDVCVLICGPERKVLTDDHFLYWRNLESPDRRVFLRSQPEPHDPSLDRAQVLVDLGDLPPGVDRLVVTLSTLAVGATLSALKSLKIRAVEPSTGSEMISYSMGSELTIETCLIIGELYRHQTNWKFRAVGQGYHTGLAGLGSDFGVNIAG